MGGLGVEPDSDVRGAAAGDAGRDLYTARKSYFTVTVTAEEVEEVS